MKRRDDRATIRDAKVIMGGPRLAKMLREQSKYQDVKKIWKGKEVGQ